MEKKAKEMEINRFLVMIIPSKINYHQAICQKIPFDTTDWSEYGLGAE